MKFFRLIILTTLATGSLLWPVAAQPENPAPTKQRVYLIPIQDQIEPALLYVIRRGVNEAIATGADAIIFVMDTPGGRVDVTREIISLIAATEVPTITYVKQNAFSAGALIALATNSIYMAPGSVIGAAMPIQMSPTGSVQDQSGDVQEKMNASVAAIARIAAETGGHRKELAEAFVRRDTELKIGDTIICESGQLLALTDQEAARIYDGEPLLSLGTVKDLEELYRITGFENAEIIELQVTPAERIARFIAMLAPLLLMAGLAGIWIEIRTPGLGLPGLGGAFCLLLFFFGHHIAGLAGMEDFLLFMLGTALLMVEVFITPGFGVLGISGLLLMGLALLNAMSVPLPGAPWSPVPVSFDAVLPALRNLMIGMTGGGLLSLLAIRRLPESRLARPLVLSEKETFRNADPGPDRIGWTGTARTSLRPAGSGLFKGEPLDVVTLGEFVDKGAAIRIIEEHGNRIVVRPVKPGEEVSS